MAFNIAHAPDRPVAQLVFAMAPVALVLTTHLLMQQASWRHQRPAESGQALVLAGQHGGTPDPMADHPDMHVAMPTALAATGGHNPATPVPTVEIMAATASVTTSPETRARRIYEAHRAAGRTLSGSASAREAGVSERHGRRLLAAFRAADHQPAHRNGDGAPPHQLGEEV